MNTEISTLFITTDKDNQKPVYKVASGEERNRLYETPHCLPVWFRLIEYTLVGTQLTVWCTSRKPSSEVNPTKLEFPKEVLYRMANTGDESSISEIFQQELGLKGNSDAFVVVTEYPKITRGIYKFFALFNKIEPNIEVLDRVPVQVDLSKLSVGDFDTYFNNQSDMVVDLSTIHVPEQLFVKEGIRKLLTTIG